MTEQPKELARTDTSPNGAYTNYCNLGFNSVKSSVEPKKEATP